MDTQLFTVPQFTTNDPTVTPITLPGRREPGAPTSNRDAARVLRAIAVILDQINDNPYRVAAYRRAAEILEQTDGDLHEHLVHGRRGDELVLPGLGERMRRKLGDLLANGRMGFTVEMRASLPDAARALLPIRSVGPRTALRLATELGLASVEDVAVAARAGRIRRLPGFGVRRERQILAAAEAVLDAPVDPNDPTPGSAALPEPKPAPVVPIRPRTPEQLRFPEAA